MASLRFMTYNVRHGQGILSPVSLARTARTIASVKPDVVALNELYRLPGRYDQPETLGRFLGMHVLFHSANTSGKLEYGNALLSRWPLRVVELVDLPKRRESRGLMVGEMEYEGRCVHVAVTHLSLHRRTRGSQVATIAEWFSASPQIPSILGGDFNGGRGELGGLEAHFSLDESGLFTYPSIAPFTTYDHLAWNRHWEMEGMSTHRSLASDHLPLYADFTLQTPPSEVDPP